MDPLTNAHELLRATNVKVYSKRNIRTKDATNVKKPLETICFCVDPN